MDASDVAVMAVVAVVVALYFGPVAFFRRYESKRSEALRSVALLLGMSFEDGRDIDATRRFGPFRLFSQGSRRKVRNCLSRTIDSADVATFGYEYRTAGSEPTILRQTVVLFRSNELSLPKFELRPRTITDRAKDLVGRDEDIDFASRREFSKSYFLRGNDQSTIRLVFSSRVLDYFESHNGLSVEGMGDRLLFYRAPSLKKTFSLGFRGYRVKPDELKDFLDEGRAVFSLFRMKA